MKEREMPSLNDLIQDFEAGSEGEKDIFLVAIYPQDWLGKVDDDVYAIKKLRKDAVNIMQKFCQQNVYNCYDIREDYDSMIHFAILLDVDEIPSVALHRQIEDIFEIAFFKDQFPDILLADTLEGVTISRSDTSRGNALHWIRQQKANLVQFVLSDLLQYD